jgi:hypothetical protein
VQSAKNLRLDTSGPLDSRGRLSPHELWICSALIPCQHWWEIPIHRRASLKMTERLAGLVRRRRRSLAANQKVKIPTLAVENWLRMEPAAHRAARMGHPHEWPLHKGEISRLHQRISRCQASSYWPYLDFFRWGERTMAGWLFVAAMGRMYQVSVGMTQRPSPHTI